MFDETGLMNSANGEFNFIKHLNFYQKLIKQLITLQCHIQSYFEAGILVWDSKLRPPNVLISGVSFRHCSLSQSCESNVLNYSECKIAKIFQGFVPGPHWGGIRLSPLLPSPPPDLSCTTVFLLAKLIKKPAPPQKKK